MQHMNNNIALVVLALSAPALAQTTDKPATDQVIVPQVERRDVKRPKYPSNDFSVGVFGGVYSTQNFGSSGVGGVRLGYHITEDFFAEAVFGKSKVSDASFRQVLPGGIFVNRSETLSYYNVSAGWNLFTGEAFFGRGTAKAWQGYIAAGVGSTDFAGTRRQTVNYGFGMRVIVNDWVGLQADVRDHTYSLDLLGKRESTHNPEVTLGFTLFF